MDLYFILLRYPQFKTYIGEWCYSLALKWQRYSTDVIPMDALVLANHNESTRNLRLYLLSVFYLASIRKLRMETIYSMKGFE